MKTILRRIDWDARPDIKKLLLAALFLVIIVYADCAFLLLGQVERLRQVCVKVNALSKDISLKSKELLSSGALPPAAGAAGKENRGTRQILKFDDLPLLLRDISVISLRDNLKIMRILPQGESRVKDSALPVKLSAVNISLELSGRFFDAVRFVSDLENYRYFLQVQDIKIRRNKKDYTSQDFSLMLKVYANKR
ncbi:MAG: type 4a pilus biogenesis protein PilO [Candidatus Omnitrophota bacterium]|jgi:Tfp pilus assembly protein PilO